MVRREMRKPRARLQRGHSVRRYLQRRAAMKSVLVAAGLLALLVLVEARRGGHRGGDNPVVTTAQGQLRGSIKQSRLGRTIYSFRGVRFAEPPVGELRFKPPVPVRAWTGVRNATEDGSACFQPTAEFVVPMSEDCLFLNVYTTKLPRGHSHPNRSVVVFFNPGAFYGFTGHSAVLGPEYLMDHDLVLVTCNYRLGPLGFASTGDSVLPGNYGMKDQVAVLRWMRQNIAAFGGNPDAITISGYSAGSTSCLLHMVSPMSRGLFQRVIAMSGSPFNYWIINREPRSASRRLAQIFNCTADTSEDIRSCLMRQDAQQLALNQGIHKEFAYYTQFMYKPVLEKEIAGEEQYLTIDPLELFLSGNFDQVPVLTGMTQDEFAWYAIEILRNDTWTEEINNDYEERFPQLFMYEQEGERSNYITSELRNFYLDNRDVENTTHNGLGLIYSDAIIGFGVYKTSKVLTCLSSKPVYYYKFSFPGRYSFYYLPDTVQPFGPTHHDDLLYVFYVSVITPYFSENDPEIRMVKKLTQIWANFIQTGNPTPNRTELLDNVIWEPITTTNKKYLEQGERLEMKQGLFQDRMDLWDRLFPTNLPPCNGRYSN